MGLRPTHGDESRCHPERSEESRSGLFSRHCEIPRRPVLLEMTGRKSFSAAGADSCYGESAISRRELGGWQFLTVKL